MSGLCSTSAVNRCPDLVSALVSPSHFSLHPFMLFASKQRRIPMHMLRVSLGAWIAALTLSPWVCGHAAAGAAELFVATGGNDAWSGKLAEANADKTDGPLASLQRARDEARQAESVRAGHGPGARRHLLSGAAIRTRTAGFRHAGTAGRVCGLSRRKTGVQRRAADHGLEAGAGQSVAGRVAGGASRSVVLPAIVRGRHAAAARAIAQRAAIIASPSCCRGRPSPMPSRSPATSSGSRPAISSRGRN